MHKSQINFILKRFCFVLNNVSKGIEYTIVQSSCENTLYLPVNYKIQHQFSENAWNRLNIIRN
jgi:hypothetical protein